MTILVEEDSSLKYTIFKVSLEQLGHSFSELSQDKQKKATVIAQRQHQIQSSILQSQYAVSTVVPEKQINESLHKIISRYASKADFDRQLEVHGLSESMLKEAIAKELKVEAILDLVSCSAPICTETDARLYYYMHPEKFKQPETRETSHILITINPQFPENTSENARERLLKIRQRILKKTKRFSEQAKKYSECPTAMEGGVIGRLQKGKLYPALDKKLFELKEGQVSDIIESPMGLHLLMCSKIYPENILPLTKVLSSIMNKMNERNQKKYQREWISQKMKELNS